MPCCGDREKIVPYKAEHQWSYINLSDFRTSSCFAGTSYGVLWIMLLVSVAVYVVDIYIAFQLLLFDSWAGQIQPAVPLTISRWVFAGCIILSLLFLVYRWQRAIRAIRSGSISRSYLDPLAVRLQSIRFGQTGRGWRRFLVFAALTKSRKGAEYVALFTYFSFEAALRIIFAEGPRQAINAITLASIMRDNVVPVGQHAASQGNSPIGQFFINLKFVAEQNSLRATVLMGMLFSLVIWIISAINLLIAFLLYITFLWHHIPEGTLAGYCRIKIEARLQRIVDAKVKKALAKEDMKRAKEDAKAVRSGTATPGLKRQPTLPVLDDEDGDDRLVEMPMLSRQTTASSHQTDASSPAIDPNYPVPSLHRQPTAMTTSDFSSRRVPVRTATQSSQASQNSAMGLVNGAAPMGFGDPRSAGPSPVSRNGSYDQPGALGRSYTGASQSTLHSSASRSRAPGIVRPVVPGVPSRHDTSASHMSAWSRAASNASPRPGYALASAQSRASPYPGQTPGSGGWSHTGAAPGAGAMDRRPSASQPGQALGAAAMEKQASAVSSASTDYYMAFDDPPPVSRSQDTGPLALNTSDNGLSQPMSRPAQAPAPTQAQAQASPAAAVRTPGPAPNSTRFAAYSPHSPHPPAPMALRSFGALSPSYGPPRRTGTAPPGAMPPSAGMASAGRNSPYHGGGGYTYGNGGGGGYGRSASNANPGYGNGNGTGYGYYGNNSGGGRAGYGGQGYAPAPPRRAATAGPRGPSWI